MSRRHRRAQEWFGASGYDRLATYNGERGRGILHTAEYDREMAVLQQRFNMEQVAEAERNGWKIVPATIPHRSSETPHG